MKNILIFILSIALILSFRQCNQNKSFAADQKSALIDSTKTFQNRIGTLTASNKVLQVRKSELKELIYSRDTTINQLRKDLSKVKTIIKTETITRIDTVQIPFEVVVPGKFERIGKHKKKFFSFDYKVNEAGLTFSNFSIPNEQISIIGFQRKWFFGKQTLKANVTNTNPFVKTINVKTVQVVVPKRFYDTRLFNIGVGFVGGLLINK